MIIVEYCPFGNLETFLQKNRTRYSDDLENDQTKDTSANSVLSVVDKKEPEDNYVDPPISTDDLISYMWQISRGMDFVASNNIIHCDLAARNILLSDANLVKICDFGLARSIKNDEIYEKKTTHLVAAKWIAPDALKSYQFTKYSDIWSFGVVMWEIASLGETPYNDIPNTELQYKLEAGYRMGCPSTVKPELHDIMLRCWSRRPEARPTFSTLSSNLNKFVCKKVRSI